jgi:hypothetical protein
MQITSVTLPVWGQVLPTHFDGGKIERAAFVRLEVA